MAAQPVVARTGLALRLDATGDTRYAVSAFAVSALSVVTAIADGCPSDEHSTSIGTPAAGGKLRFSDLIADNLRDWKAKEEDSWKFRRIQLEADFRKASVAAGHP